MAEEKYSFKIHKIAESIIKQFNNNDVSIEDAMAALESAKGTLQGVQYVHLSAAVYKASIDKIINGDK